MKASFFRLYLASAIFVSAMTTGCGVSIDNASVQAQAGSPVSTQLGSVKIPYNPNVPTYVLAIEPFTFRETAGEGENLTQINIRQGGEALAAKFTTALANIGNFSVLDSGLKKSKNGVYTAKLKKGEKGPFIIRATVTEFTEVAEASSKTRGGSLGWVGLIAGIAGAVSGKSGLGWAGAGVAAANPTYQTAEAEKKGMVGIDFRIVDGSSGRIVAAFNSTGTFAAVSASKGVSLFGIGGTDHKFAQSVLGQALAAALNDAAKQASDNLTGQVKVAQN